jgi:two-component system sensor histidine kinase DesK
MRLKLLPSSDPPARGAYFWLAYLVIPMATAAFAYPRGARVEWVTACGIAGCLPLYFWSFWLKDRRVLLAVSGLLLLGLVTTPVNTGLFVLFGYAAAVVGRIVSRAVVALTLLVIIVAATVALFFGGTPLVWIAVSDAMLIFGGTISAYFGVVGRRLLHAETEARRMAVVAERERIARDLHDLLGHTLSVIVLKSELASKLADVDAARSIAEIRDVERISREALAEVRGAVGGYRTARFVEELDHGREALAAAGVTLDAEGTAPPLEPAQEQAIALALREAITNVIRHAGANRCRVRLDASDGEIRLSVHDNGVGARGPEGSGLGGMRARATLLGGRMERSSEEGTRITIVLPLGSVR